MAQIYAFSQNIFGPIFRLPETLLTLCTYAYCAGKHNNINIISTFSTLLYSTLLLLLPDLVSIHSKFNSRAKIQTKSSFTQPKSS